MAPLARIVAPALVVAALLQTSSALAQNTAGGGVPAPHRTARYLSVKVWQQGAVAPNVSVRVPTALVSTVVGLAAWSGVLDRTIEAANEHAADCGNSVHLRITGRQIASIWSDMVGSGPADLVRVEDGTDRVVVRLE
ncbi:MAG TPA: hypothetical protein VGS03_12540 [Candidatus Polarisedimenticolia bacterium]|jgi:hypothetical protein|nr:hypothetical protein [Candidatus Polarisedimenticolia bacterium]